MHIVYVMSKEMNLSFADIKDMAFFEILRILEVYQENMEEQRKQNEKENGKYESQMSNMQSKFNMNNIQQQIPKYSAPTFNMPKI